MPKKQRDAPLPAASPAAAPPPAAVDLALSARDVEIGAAVFCVVLAVYVRTLHPTIAGGDSGELIAVAAEPGLAHPPGYPLFTMLAYLSTVLIPVGNVAWRINLFNAVCGCLAALLLYVATLWATARDHAAAILAAILMAFSPQVWLYALGGEVFALNNLFNCGLMVLVARFYAAPSIGRALAGAFVGGLALTNQHTVVFPVAVYVLAVFWRGRAFLFAPDALGKLAAAFLAGLSPYLYLPIRGMYHPVAAWGDPTTLSGFWRVLTRGDYGTFQLGSDPIGQSGHFWKRIMIFVRSSAGDTLYVGMALALVALAFVLAASWPSSSSSSSARGKKRRVPMPAAAAPPEPSPSALAITPFGRELAVVFAAAFVLYIGVFHYLANLPIDDPLMLGVQARFYPQANIIICFFAGLGLSALTRKLPSESRAYVAMAAALLLGGAQVSVNYAKMDQHDNYHSANYGRAILHSIPEGALLMTRGDMGINSVRYLQMNEGVRPDLTVIDMEMLSWPWFVKTQRANFPEVVFPGSQYHVRIPGSFNISRFFDANRERFDIYVVGGLKDGDSSADAEYELYPHGLGARVIPKSAPLDIRAWVEESAQAIPPRSILPFPDLDRYTDESWEYNVMTKYLTALDTRGYFLLTWALAHDADSWALHKTIEILEDLLLEHPVPQHWIYRNLGIAYSRLIAEDNAMMDGMLRHWSTYLEKAPADDAGIEQIRDAVDSYSEYRERFLAEQRAGQ